VLAAGLAAASCAAAERPLLEQFFGASRLRDLTALQSIATVVFEPRERGIVRTFEIRAVSPERQEGQRVTKEVTIEAPVVLPDGQIVRQTLVVILQRPAGDGRDGWLVTGVMDAPAFRSAPPP
jgi:hypothetical protein